MHTPGLAIAWSLWWRHRWGFVASGATLLVLAIIYPFLFSYTRATAAVVASIFPLVGVFGYVLNALLLAEEPGSMSSSYPRSMLALPVRTSTLVISPLLCGTLAATLLWVATSVMVYRPSGFEVPVLLPALALAAAMAWLLALAWLPIAIPWLRVPLTIGWILALAAVPLWLATTGRSSPVLLASLFIAYILAAYPAGLAAVASDRRGDLWRGWTQRSRPQPVSVGATTSRRRRSYPSAGAAQYWYEWNCHGWVFPLPVFVILILIALVTLTAPPRAGPFLFRFALGTFLVYPVLFAGAFSGALGRMRPAWVNSKKFITFVAIRPMTTGALVAAKMRMATASVLITWAVVVAGVPLWVVISGNTANARILLDEFLQRYPGATGIGILALGAVLLPAVMWKHLTDGIALGLTGRRWIAECSTYLFLGILVGLVSAGFWFAQHPRDLVRSIATIPWLVVFCVILKALIAAVTFRSALRRRLIDWPAIWTVLAIWLVLTASAAGMAMLLLSAGDFPVSRPVLVLSIAAYVPLVRFPLATLALDWNRHG